MNRSRVLAASAMLLLVASAAACSDGTSGSPRGDAGTSSPTAPNPASAAPTPTPTPSAPTPSASGATIPAVLADALRDGPTLARTPEAVVEQILAAEGAIADPDTKPEILEVAGKVQQLAYRMLSRHREWDDPVLAALPAELRPAARRNVRARREFRSMHPHPGDKLPAWRIVSPAPAEELLSYYREAERRFGVQWEYVAAINMVETAMGRIRGTSTAGAQGPMQFMPGTWDAYGKGDINSPRDSILAAGRYLSANGFNRRGGIAGALYRYNNSSAYVRGVTHLAEVMKQRPRAYFGYYHWDVYFLTSKGDIVLPVGYDSREPIPVERWLASHPQS